MNEVILHPGTKAALEAFLRQPVHAVCLIGPAGAGKAYLARQAAKMLLGQPRADSVQVIAPSPSSISIEQIRELHRFLRLKKPGNAALKRAVIIENAEKMGEEAQNALLKTLEEPPADTVFILTTDGSASLRPTIYSRVQRIQVMPLSQEQAKAAFPNAAGLTKAYHLSGGYVGLLYSLLNDTGHGLVRAVEDAKQLMNASAFERLAKVDGLAKDKEALPDLFYALERVISAALASAHSGSQVKRLAAASRAVYDAKIDFGGSVNTKLLLTDLFLSL